MRPLSVFFTAALLLLFCSPVVAKDSHRQDRVNLTVRVDSFSAAAEDLREVVDQFEAKVQNLNFNRGNSNGSASLRVSPDQLSAFVKELSTLGEVESQNQNSNDLTNQVREYKRRQKTYLAIEKLDLSATFDSLPADIRDSARTEYKQWLVNQLNSAESSLRSYAEQASYAEVQLSIRLPEVNEPELVEPEVPGDAPAVTQEEPSQGGAPSPEFFVLCLINILGLWLLYRKLDNKVVGLHD